MTSLSSSPDRRTRLQPPGDGGTHQIACGARHPGPQSHNRRYVNRKPEAEQKDQGDLHRSQACGRQEVQEARHPGYGKYSRQGWHLRKGRGIDGPNKEVLTAWQDEVPLEGGKADFKLQYRLKSGAWVELIAIAAQGVISDIWNPFGLQSAKKTIGQTFLALDSFTGVGLSTPTWNTANSGCTVTLYSAEGKNQPVESPGKLATRWGEIKNK